ncbi:TetR/AcrR family transcriptional regulator [Cohnella endophytica]|uniref:TetR/AcrR family transcriptional regulator n=1 Tax=Cohnella endophytica TaxID=2419778 RepID=A0A494XMH1_9BACL|nr:TetR/AcrR family transcriptional regulator [Cohnella endophytica]RKP48733.1 TetR/AcrR family transcriptional regulator [Cohnella endophytica]
MSLLKQTIMDSATRFFSEKGYDMTSIQEIADDCGIAKGSLYKFFPSKEELLIEIFLTQSNRIFEAAEQIRQDGTLAPREAFIRETECNFDFFLENKFFMREIKQLSNTSKKIMPFMYQMRTKLLVSCKDGLLKFLGKDVEPNIWELVFVYSGIMKEFMSLVVFDNKPLNIRDVSAFIADRVEELANYVRLKKPATVLPDSIMAEFCIPGAGDPLPTFAEHRTSLLQSMRTTIQELPCTHHRKSELDNAVTLLETEFDSDEPKPVLLQALIQFLAAEYPLACIAKQLEKYKIQVPE